MRRPIVAGNWKLNRTAPQAAELIAQLKPLVAEVTAVEMVVCPPFTSLAAAHQALAGSRVGLGAQDAVAGGGRYNGLAKELGGPDLPAIGFAIGEDRLLEVLPQDFGQDVRPRIFVAALGEPARERAFTMVQELRRKDLAAEMDFEGRSLKAQMSMADRLNAAYAVIVGDQELETGLAQVRPMKKFSQETGGKVKLTEVGAGRTLVEQEQVPFEDLMDYLTGKIRAEETR